jgi:outer membrane protein assembly factor BamB
MYRSSAEPNRTLLVVAFRGKLFALERTTGRRVWRLEIDSTTHETPIDLVVGDNVVVACSVNKLSFVEYATGRLLGFVQREESGRPTMLIDGEQLIVGAYGAVACYTLTGQLLWRDGFSGEGYGAVAIGFPGNVRQADG